MARFLSKGLAEQSCIEFALGTRYFVPLDDWPMYWTVVPPEDSTHIGIFRTIRSTPEGSTRPEDLSLDHVARVKRKAGTPSDWVLDQKIAVHGGRYETTLAEVTNGFQADCKDPGCRRYRGSLIRYPGHVVYLKRNDVPAD